MTRRLLAEGTSFKALCADLRQELGLKLVADVEIRLSHASLLLGFSRVQGFHRAFRRWTGMTPTQYRRMHADTPALSDAVAEAAVDASRLQ
jgi:AraC-like DNA-binding protein